MAKISDLSGDERAQRIAELKRKMQEAAKQAQANAAAGEHEAAADDAPVAAAAPTAAGAVTKPVATVEAEVSVVSAAETAVTETAVTERAVTERAVTETVGEVPAVERAAEDTPTAPTVETVITAPATNGTNGAAPVTASTIFVQEQSEEERLKAEMNRREFLTYAWGASLGLLAVGSGVVSFFFMYPRFKAGEFGGKFLMGPESALPPTDVAPIGMVDGKFWWVNVEDEGPRAIYMVCTHLGCLYKWVDERNRFECPCHGSKFTREGFYIEGPAPRSLDQFVVELVDGDYSVDTGAKIAGPPADESPAKGVG